jgi:hypothetical protein
MVSIRNRKNPRTAIFPDKIKKRHISNEIAKRSRQHARYYFGIVFRVAIIIRLSFLLLRSFIRSTILPWIIT